MHQKCCFFRINVQEQCFQHKPFGCLIDKCEFWDFPIFSGLKSCDTETHTIKRYVAAQYDENTNYMESLKRWNKVSEILSAELWNVKGSSWSNLNWEIGWIQPVRVISYVACNSYSFNWLVWIMCKLNWSKWCLHELPARRQELSWIWESQKLSSGLCYSLDLDWTYTFRSTCHGLTKLIRMAIIGIHTGDWIPDANWVTFLKISTEHQKSVNK